MQGIGILGTCCYCKSVYREKFVLQEEIHSNPFLTVPLIVTSMTVHYIDVIIVSLLFTLDTVRCRNLSILQGTHYTEAGSSSLFLNVCSILSPLKDKFVVKKGEHFIPRNTV